MCVKRRVTASGWPDQGRLSEAGITGCKVLSLSYLILPHFRILMLYWSTTVVSTFNATATRKTCYHGGHPLS
jgi:hypothetical protein